MKQKYAKQCICQQKRVKEDIQQPQSRPSFPHGYGIFQQEKAPAATFWASQTACTMRSSLAGWEEPGTQEEFVPLSLESTKNNEAPTQALLDLQPNQDRAVVPSWGDKIFYCLKNNNEQSKSTLWFMQFNLLEAIRPAGAVPGIEKFNLEVGRKILFNSIFNTTVFLFRFGMRLEKFLDY